MGSRSRKIPESQKISGEGVKDKLSEILNFFAEDGVVGVKHLPEQPDRVDDRIRFKSQELLAQNPGNTSVNPRPALREPRLTYQSSPRMQSSSCPWNRESHHNASALLLSAPQLTSPLLTHLPPPYPVWFHRRVQRVPCQGLPPSPPSRRLRPAPV